jgi:hypothetical protein
MIQNTTSIERLVERAFFAILKSQHAVCWSEDVHTLSMVMFCFVLGQLLVVTFKALRKISWHLYIECHL